MTRVEKFHRYREEIANMKVDSESLKKEAASRLEKNSSSKLDLNQVMSAYDVYDANASSTSKRRLFRVRKYQLFYCLIAFFIIAIILIATILVGIKVWGN